MKREIMEVFFPTNNLDLDKPKRNRQDNESNRFNAVEFARS
jgi:hypothetical protein